MDLQVTNASMHESSWATMANTLPSVKMGHLGL